MLQGWLVILISLAYVGLLFGLAYWGDQQVRRQVSNKSQPVIYSLSLAAYCTSWTFYGAVGRAASTGWEFLATYIGPVVVFVFGIRLLGKLVQVSKKQNITSVSDFLASRYGKSQGLGAVVACMTVISILPYISLQLKAVAMSFNVLTGTSQSAENGSDTALFVALLMSIFAILFGTRQIDATEHHRGMVLAIAFESIVKLTAFLSVGFFVVFGIYNGFEDLYLKASVQLADNNNFKKDLFAGSFLTECFLAVLAVICLPRQFHMTIVENTHPQDLRTARWLFPLYMILMSLFVLPIATAGMATFPSGFVNADSFVLTLPLSAKADGLAVFAYIGGLSAATSMVIVASVALSTMICNDLIMPIMFKLRGSRLSNEEDIGALLLNTRRVTIFCLLLLAYFYYRLLGAHTSLADIGLMSFVAVAQFAPALIGGLYWKKGSHQGVMAGLLAGFAIWAYTLLIPALIQTGLLSPTLLAHGPFGQPWLEPHALFGLTGLDPITHGTLWSLLVNTCLYVWISKHSNQRLIDRIQSSSFVDTLDDGQLGSSRNPTEHISVGDLQMLTERFLGVERTQRAFRSFYHERHQRLPNANEKAPSDLIHFCERLLGGVIGASSARIVIGSTLRGRDMQIGDVVTIVDEASQALQFNRSMLQATIENISLGITVVDNQQRLMVWNRAYLAMFSHPPGLISVGRPIEEVYRHLALQGEFGPGDPEEHVHRRMELLKQGRSNSYERHRADGTVLEVRGNQMPGGGYVTTYTDITQYKRTESALRESERSIRIYTDNVPALIAYFDSERRYRFINQAYEDMFGLDRNSIAGIPCYDVLPPAEYAQREPYISNVLAGQRQTFEITLPPLDDDHERYAQVTYLPHINEEGHIIGYFSVYIDITERRKAEMLLQQTNEDLETRVHERTQALSIVNQELRKENIIRSLIEDELRQAKGEAEAANLSKTRFLAAASHDLLQPLNAARLFSSALSQRHYDEMTHELVGNLDGSLKAAEELISTILDISKLDAGALQPNLSHFPVERLFNALKAEFTALAQEKGLTFHLVNSQVVIHSDSQLLRRVVQNFLSNAIRYTRSGKVLLGCRRTGDAIRIEVWDSGVGIAEDKIHEIFEEFKRLNNPQHADVKGLGLGLAITDRIARILGHSIQVRSQVGKGTVFSIRVPLGETDKVQNVSKRGGIASRRKGGLDQLHVLVVDNEQPILNGMKALLEGWGCEVRCALSEQQALDILDNDPEWKPGILLADYHLDNDLTGVMTINAVRSRLQHAIPAIVITADRTDEIKDEIHQTGAFVLQKPVKPAALRALISRHGIHRSKVEPPATSL
ncbi:histidine kinase [Pokkaliibacter plantistimulans]|uniref:histidine kinase n=1 Tax=Pokkaliibacter plantistimulans TaxID=1635171 RepID=A0ABX5M0H2_9GAMM|nr:NahK/ErcS family hybrid sensor histidine kinase/response regulator [Pokkaliibacter plantistimulans]PXF32364.1 histidine kinase [Pokkaliibacter plantistimulans]